MNGKVLSVFALAAVCVCAVACAGCIASDSLEIPEGTWILDGTDLPLTINADGTFAGQAVINSYSGKIVADGDKIKIEDFLSTLKAGAPEDMENETKFFKAFTSAQTFKVEASTLTFFDANNTAVLTFVKPIVGDWKNADGVTIAFSADGKLSGHAAVNIYTGTYKVNGDDKIELSDISLTLMSADDESMKEEAEYIKVLETTKGYKVDGDVLELKDFDGKTILKYDRV